MSETDFICPICHSENPRDHSYVATFPSVMGGIRPSTTPACSLECLVVLLTKRLSDQRYRIGYDSGLAQGRKRRRKGQR